MNARNVLAVAAVLTWTGFANVGLGQEVLLTDPALNAVVRAELQKPAGPLTQQDFLNLTNLTAISRGITNLQGLGAARNLTTLVLDDNRLTNSSFSNELTQLRNLSVVDLSENPFTALALPNGLTILTRLRIESGHLTQLTLPTGLSQLAELRLGFNQITNLALQADMTNLTVLSAFNNRLADLSFPANLPNLNELNLDGNQLLQLQLPAGLSKLSSLIAGANQLTSFTVPAETTNLVFLRLNDNQLTNLTLHAGLGQLSLLHLPGNQLQSLRLPGGLTNLSTLNLTGNQLTNLTLPPDVTQLSALFLEGNPLSSFVLSEPMAATQLAGLVASLRTQSVDVLTYPLTTKLVTPRPVAGAIDIGLTSPPGTYIVLSSTNLANWTQTTVVSNQFGAISFVETNSPFFAQRFYQVLNAPANMVFIPPTVFTMGSPTNDLDSSVDERPQTLVTLAHGFWIGQYEVTQGEYLSVMNTNPSAFRGDLSRPITDVSWYDATNYCGRLTERELAARRIPRGTRFRLPTEAEWECAARAGTSTRFSYSDDPGYASTTNYAWELSNANLIVHPVGQKLPNSWGLYDMHGNVWEWCLDWYDTFPGGGQTDPTGPAGPVQSGAKVIRGGAYDYPNSSCRSASRLPSTPSHLDTDLGFRIVLELEQVQDLPVR